MSRSYRKVPIVRQEREDYHYLNKQLRLDKLAEIPKGSAYKKHRPHWNTWHYIWTWEDAKKEYYKYAHINEKYTIEEYHDMWERWAVRK